MIAESSTLKGRVKAHWEREACGTRYGSENDRKLFFDEISEARYKLEPFIPAFADFPSAGNKAILEIGVGAGADFQNWCNHAHHATGVDLTEKAIALTRERLELNSIAGERYTLRTADAENLPFNDASFDLVYSWGVLHHTPDTEGAFREVFRVLKPGGVVRAMIYHVPSWSGLMLYLRCGLARGKFGMTMKQAIFADLESPGTKAYSLNEARDLVNQTGFESISVSAKLSPGDLLAIKPSAKYSSPFFKLIWRVYPRWLVRSLGDRYGLDLLIEARKPQSDGER
ncbi:MAG TPA: class I SAM-dependent methyltransferase [Blastocatellia bacterium]|nr:class I SAM-dependent methyltransferase [Blastocatellia bacterium]